VQNRTNDLVDFRIDAMQWVVRTPFAEPLRRTVIPHLGHLEAAGGEQVKQTVTRSVHRIELAGQLVYVKHHRVRSLAEALKYLVLRSRASAEWAALREMAERGLPVPRAVALGERRVLGVFREAALITEAVEDAVPFNQALDRRAGLLDDAARLIRTLHDAHVHHRDLHGGNILVAGDALHLIDVHNVRIGPPVSKRERLAGAAQFLAALRPGGDREVQQRFIRAYLGPDAPGKELAAFARGVAQGVVRNRERRYASRAKRCLKRSTGFRHELLEGLAVHRRADVPADHLLEAIARHRKQTGGPGGEGVLKRDHRARISVVELPGGGRACVKEFIRHGLARLGDLWRGSPAKRAWRGSHACAVRGLGTPRALAMAEAPDGRSFFVAEYLGGAEQLNDYVADRCRPEPGGAARRWHAFVRAAADFVRRLHSHRLRHRDLSAKNILVREEDGGWAFDLVDVADVRGGRAPSLGFRVANLGQLDQIYVRPARSDRLRFYRHYARGRPELDRPELLRRIDAISRARHRHWLECGGREILEERRRQGKPL